mgnify:CR=1 FL=1
MSALSDYLSERRRIDGLSVRAFARRCEVAQTTAQRLLSGTAVPDYETLEKVAEKLPAPLNKLLELAEVKRPEPFILPSWADKLSDRERRAVVRVVRVIAEAAGHIPVPDVDSPDEEDAPDPVQLTAGTPPRERARVVRAARKRTSVTDSDGT